MNVSLIIVAIGSVFLMFEAARKHESPTWARQALALAGILFLSWSIASYLLEIHSTLIPQKLIWTVKFVKAQIGGIAFGIIITLYMSKALSKHGLTNYKPDA